MTPVTLEEEEAQEARSEAPSLTCYYTCPSNSFSPSDYQTCSLTQPLSATGEEEEETEQETRYAYYTCVKTVNGVAIAWETKAGFCPVRNRPQVFEMALTVRKRAGKENHEEKDPEWSNMSNNSGNNSDKPWLDSPWEDHEAYTSEPTGDTEERRAAPKPPAMPTTSEACRENREIPDWLSTTSRGFRCMACCRVFPSLKAFRQHVTDGEKEGFTCHIFHQKMREKRRVSRQSSRKMRNRRGCRLRRK
ncbi:protein FAM170B-like [Ornithorhynchus anatinus]|uniref:protein FAM170B-like n=1 Tax=Ornithorhynchus anatinus TaxID=9258 RepID=UPI0010A8AB46|nr:protein FAM170B-like [Ornithorhynchus anatinus]